LCGEGPRKSILQALAGGLDNVQFLPLQPHARLGELLNTADFHLIPQLAEAADLVLPSKLGGIFASGRPVIAMASAGTGLAMEVGDAGLIVSPGDAEALAVAMRELAENSDLRAALGARARQRALEKWDKKSVLRLLERELVSLCKQAQPGEVLESVPMSPTG
jgi:colanic acid biosynthesis glycosyl transferase WcaI